MKNMSNMKPTGDRFTFSLETPSLSSGTLDKYLKSVLGEDSASAIPDLLKSSTTPNTLNAIGNEHLGRQREDSSDDKHVPTILPITSPTNLTSSSMPNIHSTNNIPQTPTLSGHEVSIQSDSSHLGHQLATTSENNELIPVPRGQNYVDITDYLNMPQADAAKKLGIPPSTLSKRWKEAVRKRKWPYRMICKIDKEIMTLLHNVPQGPNAPPLPEEIETALGISLRKRQEELRPVVIRI